MDGVGCGPLRSVERIDVIRPSFEEGKQLRKPGAGRAKFLSLFLVDEERLGVARLYQVYRLLRGELVVDGNDDCSRFQDGEIGDRPFG